MSFIKEYYKNQISLSEPGNLDAKPMETGTISILRPCENNPLSTYALKIIFNEIAKDFPTVDSSKIFINAQKSRVEVYAEPPQASRYIRLPNVTTSTRG